MTGAGQGAGAADGYVGRWWHPLDDGRIQCDLCPRECRLRDGQRGFCFVRERRGDAIVLDTYGRSSGFCIDPIEKKPLNHFHPGSAVLSFGTAGCNLACRFCQNWDISTSREIDSLADEASPERLAEAAVEHGCESVAFTYNDPTIFAEYAIDVAAACRERGVKSVAVSAGWISPEPRRELYAAMDAANIDLKGFTDEFYRRVTGARLGDVLETLEHIRHATDCWLEITTLLIPGHNDSDAEIAAMAEWIVEHLGDDVPHHFSAFHPDHRMRDVPRTPVATLRRARELAMAAGERFVYTGNVHDAEGDTTRCTGCGAAVIERDWYRLLAYRLDAQGRCTACGTALPGRFGAAAGEFGARRIPIRLAPRA
ncbi:MAG: AmmeMemoRadiSam system radical SAM enzyme [Microbacteriaceae bacterium]|nr:AmmeMemoRadiSam system radical SAM enzyme [Microbacteriaceae bacterium]